MKTLATLRPLLVLPALLTATLALPAFAAEEAEAPKGAAVTVLKAAKACFGNWSRSPASWPARRRRCGRAARPEGRRGAGGRRRYRHRRADAGAAQAARGRRSGGPGAGGRHHLRLHRHDRRRRVGQGRGAVYHHRAQRIRSGRPGAGARISKLAVNQPRGSRSSAPAMSRAGSAGSPRPSSRTASSARSSSRITPTRRLLVNSSGRAVIKTGQSCGVSVPLTAILYGPAGTVVQVVRRDRVETRRVEVGLMSAARSKSARAGRRRHRGGARRRAAARGRSGAAGDGGADAK